MKKILNKLFKNWINLSKKRKFFYSFSGVFVLLFMVVPYLLYAANPDSLAGALQGMLSTLVLAVVDILGTVVILEMKMMVWLAQWSNFTKGVFAVEQGWIIVRDLCNMFFVLVLLVISFSTILKLESYAYKKWLGKLIIFAVLINFSKTITGLLIDFSQVIMLTFVHSFQDAVAGNIASGLHLNELLESNMSDKTKKNKLDSLEILGSAVLAMILMAIFGIVVLIMIVILVGRIVSLWVLTILSPFAYLLQASPIGTKYASQWWQEFSKNLISGPVLAFFLWLTLFTIQSAGEKNENVSYTLGRDNVAIGGVKNKLSLSDKDKETLSKEVKEVSDTLTNAGKPSVLLDFIVVIALLMAAIKTSQSLGVIGSQFAGKAVSGAGKAVRVVGGFVGRRVGKAAKRGIWDPLDTEISKNPFLKHIPGTTYSKLAKKKKEENYNLLQEDRENSVIDSAKKSYRKGGLFNQAFNANLAETSQDSKDRQSFGGYVRAFHRYKAGSQKNIDEKKAIITNKEGNYTKKQIEEAENYILDYTPKVSNSTMVASSQALDEAEKKLKHLEGSTGSSQLSYAKNALRNMQKSGGKSGIAEVQTILNTMMKDVNFDDLMEEYGYNNNAEGLSRFIQEELADKGMDKNKALSIQDLMSKTAGNVGEMQYIKSTSIGLDGNFESVINKDSNYNTESHDKIVGGFVNSVVDGLKLATNLKQSFYVNSRDEFNPAALKVLQANSKGMIKNINRMTSGAREVINNNSSYLSNNGVDNKFLDDVKAMVEGNEDNEDQKVKKEKIEVSVNSEKGIEDSPIIEKNDERKRRVEKLKGLKKEIKEDDKNNS